ncbi:GNAT family N-acetyltransferase [Leucobacter triazinivorans]|uniref:GNAT family N-acetyltransferase n=1 Tax=Leucobacter triazinivorans TaxID=1784719 RepID=A0A4P6KGT7_9MICO|nr:GNAT family N-acetyltransferase [Leucobacter triazinivorans]QBE49552.1 GNAT family N-acetyltransferase [Leucobacter triazinivorans]
MSTDLQRPRIRPYERADAARTLETFIAAVTRIAAADYTREQIRAWARPEQRDPESWHPEMNGRNSFVATLDGDVAGFSDVAADGRIDMMFVSPEQQRRGVARELLAEAERRAGERGAEELYADVSITARPLFERYGFRVEREQRPVRHGIELVNFRMRKRLTGPTAGAAGVRPIVRDPAEPE